MDELYFCAVIFIEDILCVDMYFVGFEYFLLQVMLSRGAGTCMLKSSIMWFCHLVLGSVTGN